MKFKINDVLTNNLDLWREGSRWISDMRLKEKKTTENQFVESGNVKI